MLAAKGNAVITAKNDCTVSDIINILGTRKIGATVVLDKNDEVCGIISERDIVRDIALHGRDLLDSPVSACMTPNVISCTTHNTVNEVMEIMTKNRFRHLPVMEEGKLLGLISIGDVVKRKIEQAEREAADMREYIAAT